MVECSDCISVWSKAAIIYLSYGSMWSKVMWSHKKEEWHLIHYTFHLSMSIITESEVTLCNSAMFNPLQNIKDEEQHKKHLFNQSTHCRK